MIYTPRQARFVTCPMDKNPCAVYSGHCGAWRWLQPDLPPQGIERERQLGYCGMAPKPTQRVKDPYIEGEQ